VHNTGKHHTRPCLAKGQSALTAQRELHKLSLAQQAYMKHHRKEGKLFINEDQRDARRQEEAMYNKQAAIQKKIAGFALTVK